jgi:hypothetical protein
MRALVIGEGAAGGGLSLFPMVASYAVKRLKVLL